MEEEGEGFRKMISCKIHGAEFHQIRKFYSRVTQTVMREPAFTVLYAKWAQLQETCFLQNTTLFSVTLSGGCARTGLRAHP